MHANEIELAGSCNGYWNDIFTLPTNKPAIQSSLYQGQASVPGRVGVGGGWASYGHHPHLSPEYPENHPENPENPQYSGFSGQFFPNFPDIPEKVFHADIPDWTGDDDHGWGKPDKMSYSRNLLVTETQDGNFKI